MLSLRIALRYLFSRKSHSAVNIITGISLAGVAVATIAIVCVLSVFNGFSWLATERLSMMDPQLMIDRADGQPIVRADSLAQAIVSANPDVEMALPTLTGQALLIYRDSQMPARIKGVPDGYAELTGIKSLLVDGEYIDGGYTGYLGSDPSIPCAAISIGVWATLQSPPGYYDPLMIYAPRRTARINPANPLGAFAADTALVSAVFQVDQPEYDADLAIIPLASARALLEYTDEATAIELKLKPGASEPQAKAALQSQLGDSYRVRERLEQQQQSFRLIAVEKWITFLLLAFILIIASFNIISTLSILIIEKEQNIATMTALGAPRRLITRIFMLEGWLVSLGGGIVGIAVGVTLCLLQQRYGLVKLAADTSRLTIDAYPVRVQGSDLLIVLALVAFIGLLSTAVTARFVRSTVGKNGK